MARLLNYLMQTTELINTHLDEKRSWEVSLGSVKSKASRVAKEKERKNETSKHQVYLLFPMKCAVNKLTWLSVLSVGRFKKTI